MYKQCQLDNVSSNSSVSRNRRPSQQKKLKKNSFYLLNWFESFSFDFSSKLENPILVDFKRKQEFESRRTHRLVDGQKVRQTNQQTNRQIERPTNRHTDRQTKRKPKQQRDRNNHKDRLHLPIDTITSDHIKRQIAS